MIGSSGPSSESPGPTRSTAAASAGLGLVGTPHVRAPVPDPEDRSREGQTTGDQRLVDVRRHRVRRRARPLHGDVRPVPQARRVGQRVPASRAGTAARSALSSLGEKRARSPAPRRRRRGSPPAPGTLSARRSARGRDLSARASRTSSGKHPEVRRRLDGRHRAWHPAPRGAHHDRAARAPPPVRPDRPARADSIRARPPRSSRPPLAPCLSPNRHSRIALGLTRGRGTRGNNK